MKGARFGYAPNPSGGRMVCWWGGRQVLGEPHVNLYPQWEVALQKESGTDTRLCLKVSVEDASGKLLSRIRNVT